MFEMVPASDGSVFVVAGDDRVAGAPAGQRTLALDDDWARFSDQYEFIIRAAGGRWPDDAYITGWVAGRGPDPGPEVVSRKDGKWSMVGVLSEPGHVGYYASYHTLADGRVLAVRVQEPEPRAWEPEDEAGQTSKVRGKPRKPTRVPPPPAWDVLLGTGPTPPPPPSGDVQGLVMTPGGGHAIVVLPFEVLRAGHADRRWTSLPDPGDGFDGSFGGVLAVDRDGHLYVGNCGERESLLVRWVDAHWESVGAPNGACILSLAFDAEGSLWISQGGLHRRRHGGDWEAIPITTEGSTDIKTSRVRFVFQPDGILWIRDAEYDGGALIVTTQTGWSALDLNRRFAPRPG